jgi:TonB-dependent starch-binding outer membrane protein SusC
MNRVCSRPFVTVAVVLAACSGQQSSGVRASRPSGSGIVITAEDIQHMPGQSLEQILTARVPGLTVSQGVVHLRGSSSTFYGVEEPLFVVNGIALGPNSSSNLLAINPRDIESITVLRDAASTAGYGARGVNGVILIRTKQS